MGNSASALPFVVEDEVQGYPESGECFWRLHKGKKRGGGDAVSIFRLTMKMCPHYATEGGRHGFQKLRTLRHPHVLACLDSAELDTEIVLATEEVTPLQEWIQQRCEPGKKDDQVAWGLHCLCSALKFLHEDCKLSHNNISMDTVFVTSGGDWKLGGMDLLGPLDGSMPELRERGGLQPRPFRAPERNHDDWWRSAGPVHSMDVYALGRLLEKVYPEGTPAALDKYLGKMLLPDPSKRPTPAQYLRCAFVRRQTVKDLIALELFSVKSAEEKGELMQRFTSESHPKEALMHKVVPLLLRELSVSTGSAPPGAQGQAAVRSTVSLCLPRILELSKEMDDDMFRATVQPALASLFVVNDRGVRVMLLTNIPSYASRLEDKVVNDQIFEPLCAGFTDGAAALRELTLKSMVAFTSRLSEKNMNDKLIKHLARLQGDAEDSIRTNAIIFLGKVAAQLKPTVRDKILLPAFARGVKDPFVATRLAGLRATAACHQHFQAEEVCTKVLPSVMLCLIDRGSISVREAAFACVETYMIKLKEVSQRMQVEEEERRQAEAAERAAELAARGANTTAGGGGATAGGGGLSATGFGSGANDAGASAKKSSATSEWGSWALSKLTTSLASSAVPNGPMGDSSASSPQPTSGGMSSASSPSGGSMPRHLASQVPWNGSGTVSAGIPGSVAAAVAAGMPVGGGSGMGAGDDPTGDEEWQDARETISNAGTEDSNSLHTGAEGLLGTNSLGTTGRSLGGTGSLRLASASIAENKGTGEGWDWGGDGLDGLGDDDASASNAESIAGLSTGVSGRRVASLGTARAAGAAGAAGAGRGSTAGDAARRREELQRRREARKAQRETKPKPVLPTPKATKLLDASPPDGWEDF